METYKVLVDSVTGISKNHFKGETVRSDNFPPGVAKKFEVLKFLKLTEPEGKAKIGK